MGYLEKEFILHQRDEKGKLLPIDVQIPELDNKTVSIIPVSRGEILRLSKEKKDKTTWEDFVIQHVVRPKFTKEELSSVKLIQVDGKYREIIDIFVEAIYLASGIEITTKKEDVAQEQEDKLKKK